MEGGMIVGGMAEVDDVNGRMNDSSGDSDASVEDDDTRVSSFFTFILPQYGHITKHQAGVLMSRLEEFGDNTIMELDKWKCFCSLEAVKYLY